MLAIEGGGMSTTSVVPIITLAALMAGVPASAGAQETILVRISAESAVVSPVKTDSLHWDGLGNPGAEGAQQQDAAQRAVATIARGAVHVVVTGEPISSLSLTAAMAGGGLVNDVTHAPDVFAVLSIDDVPRAQTTHRQDTIAPSWSGPWSEALRISTASAIQIDFYDFDVGSRHDHVGTCRWTGLRGGSDAYVMTATSCSGQVLQAQIYVQPVLASEPRVDAQPESCSCQAGRRIEVACSVQAGDVDADVQVQVEARTGTMGLRASASGRGRVAAGTRGTIRVVAPHGGLMDCSSTRDCRCARLTWDPVTSPSPPIRPPVTSDAPDDD